MAEALSHLLLSSAGRYDQPEADASIMMTEKKTMSALTAILFFLKKEIVNGYQLARIKKKRT